MKNKTKLLGSSGTRKLVFVVVISVLLLALTQLAISHQLANSGEKIRRFEEETARLEEENRALIEQISKLSSLSKISLQAEKLGFLRTTRVLHLTPQVSVALK
jgi:cell division protein FtsL